MYDLCNYNKKILIHLFKLLFSIFVAPSFKVAYLGLSFDLSCIVDNPENYNFTFFLKKPSQSQSTKLDINGNNRFKQDRSILTITKVIFGDGGVYSCEVRNQTNYLVKRIELQHVFVQKGENDFICFV